MFCIYMQAFIITPPHSAGGVLLSLCFSDLANWVFPLNLDESWQFFPIVEIPSASLTMSGWFRINYLSSTCFIQQDITGTNWNNILTIFF